MHNEKEEFLGAIQRHEHEASLNKNLPQGNELYLNALDFEGLLHDEILTPPFSEPEKFRHLIAGLTTLLQPGWKVKLGFRVHKGEINGYEINLFATHTDKKVLLRESPVASIIKPEELMTFPNDEEIYMGQSRLGRALDPYMRGTNLLVDKTYESVHKIHVPGKEKPHLFRHGKKEYIGMYQEGVRDLKLRLIPISNIIGTINDSMINNPTDEYVEEAEKRRNELGSWIVSNPMPVFTYQNLKPLPHEFKKSLEKLKK